MNEISFLNLRRKWFMKNNKKILSLLNHGFKGSLLNTLNETQIDSLYLRLSEQVKIEKQPAKDVVVVGKQGGQIPKSDTGYKAETNPDGSMKLTPMESEISEDEESDINWELTGHDQEPIQKGPTGDGDPDSIQEKELMEKFASQKQQKYFFAKCGDGKTKEEKKWCKMAEEFAEKTNFKKLPKTKKKETKEEFTMKNYLDKVGSVYANNMKGQLSKITKESMNKKQLEKGIMSLVEKHITPKMSKRDLLNLVSEQGTKEKERTKEKEKTKSPERDNPYAPKPGPKKSPKAGDTKIAPPIPKTPTKPGKPDTNTPYNPKVKPAPKADKGELPNWLTFDAIGINIK